MQRNCSVTTALLDVENYVTEFFLEKTLVLYTYNCVWKVYDCVWLWKVWLICSVVTDSEFASESANFSSVCPSPSPRIFGGRKWRFWNVAWIATPAAHVTIRADHTSKTTVQYRQSPRSRRPTFDAVNALQLTVGMLTPTASSSFVWSRQ